MSTRSRILPRRSCHAVPGSSARFIAKAQDLPADMVFFDLEDSVAPSEKDGARKTVGEAIYSGSWANRIICVRINDWSTPWTLQDLREVILLAGPRLDEVMLPKVEHSSQVAALDIVLGQLENEAGIPVGHIGIEVQIETPKGLMNVEDICSASDRLEAVIFGPADYSASIGMPTLIGGTELEGYPGDHFHYAFSRILVAGRAHHLQVIDGPYLKVRDLDGLRSYSQRARLLGFDGKWTLHPAQIEVVNDVFSPSQSQLDSALAIVKAYEKAQERGVGALMLGDEMIDEASRKMALMIIERAKRFGS